MQYEDIRDKLIALLIWNADKEDDVRVFTGKIIQEGPELIFINPTEKWRVPLTEEQFQRLEIVTEVVKEIFLDADYFISMTMGSLSEGSTDSFDPTGLKWHE